MNPGILATVDKTVLAKVFQTNQTVCRQIWSKIEKIALSIFKISFLKKETEKRKKKRVRKRRKKKRRKLFLFFDDQNNGYTASRRSAKRERRASGRLEQIFVT